MLSHSRVTRLRLSSRAQRGICFCLTVTTILGILFCASASAEEKHPRPRILGIAHLIFYTTNLSAARTFYSQIIDPKIACPECDAHPIDGIHIKLPSGQEIGFVKPTETAPSNFLVNIIFATDNLNAMRRYLATKGVAVEPPKAMSDGSLKVTDPEGHLLGFVQVSKGWSPSNTDALRIIHAGFVVHDRSAEDQFYKDILGFHLYWHGGMEEGKDRWVAMQVPDGTDWVEYMLNIPPDASKHTLGVMNHMALGVTDIHATQQRIIANGAKPTEEPKVGRDGKWQLNLYDPDETRTEFMEFTPKEKPCCSEFTGPHPGPQK